METGLAIAALAISWMTFVFWLARGTPVLFEQVASVIAPTFGGACLFGIGVALGATGMLSAAMGIWITGLGIAALVLLLATARFAQAYQRHERRPRADVPRPQHAADDGGGDARQRPPVDRT